MGPSCCRLQQDSWGRRGYHMKARVSRPLKYPRQRGTLKSNWISYSFITLGDCLSLELSILWFILNPIKFQMEIIHMKSTTNTPLVIAFVIVVVLFLGFGGGAMTGGMMNGGMNGSGWMGERGWMWTPSLLALGVGVVLGWIIFKKKG